MKIGTIKFSANMRLICFMRFSALPRIAVMPVAVLFSELLSSPWLYRVEPLCASISFCAYSITCMDSGLIGNCALAYTCVAGFSAVSQTTTSSLLINASRSTLLFTNVRGALFFATFVITCRNTAVFKSCCCSRSSVKPSFSLKALMGSASTAK